ncbi:MAG: cyclin-dependent kinase inhibitor 3 family protein [Gammaproteobacteria bacterium]
MVITRLTTPLQIDSVSVECSNGIIGMSQCPGRIAVNAIEGSRDRDLDADLKEICDWGASALVTLMEKEEMEWLGVADLPDKAIQIGLEHYHLPIMDMDIPDEQFEYRWKTAGESLRKLLLSDQSIVIHCLAGLGRTGTVAARLLVELGAEPETAIRQIRMARPGTIQTIMQEAYLRRIK